MDQDLDQARTEARWLAAVRPIDWQNPQPADRYDLVVVGGGPAGLVAAAGAAGLGLGLNVALVERHYLGGDCLNVGCVPSKSLIQAGRSAVSQISPDLGVSRGPAAIDLAAVWARLRRVRADLSPNDAADRFRGLGVDVFFGEGQFVDRQTIAVGPAVGPSLHLPFRRAIVATGARSARPDLPGLTEAGFLTNETIFELTRIPSSLAILGGGPIGCELGQALARLGIAVTLIQRGDRLLPREDPAVAAIVQAALEQDGVTVLTGTEVVQVHRGSQDFSTGQGDRDPRAALPKVLVLNDRRSISVAEILVATGRQPNVQGLALEAAGITYDDRAGVAVNDYLQTTNPQVWAIGDVIAPPHGRPVQFTHAADAMARLALKNALFAPFGLGRSRFSALTIPWTTYTDPEVARVGLSPTEAIAQGLAVRSITIDLADLDRSHTDDRRTGFLTIVHPVGSDRILGATLVAPHAGETIGQLTLAIDQGLGLNALAQTIHTYPTQAECLKKAADAYRRSLLNDRSRYFLSLLARLSLGNVP